MPPPPGPRRPPAKVLPPDAPSVRALTSLVTGVVVICALYFGRAVMIPIILAVLLSFLLAPFVDFLRRFRFGQVPSVIVAVLVALSVLTAVGALIGAQVAQLAGDLPKYQVAVERKIESVQKVTVGRADAMLGKASRALKRLSPAREQEANKNENDQAASPIDQPMPVEVHEPSPSPLQLAQRFLSPVISPLETTGIVLVVAIFILLQREDLRDRLIRLFGSRDLHRTTTAMDEAARRLSRYFLAQLGINVGVGIVVSIGLAIIGVPGALLFGVLTALLRFVPYVGTWIAALVAVVFAAAVGPGWTMLIWTIVLFGVTDVVAGQVVEPLLYGHSTGLSPFAVIVAAIFWSWIWGPVGLVLSTPLTLCLVILGRHVDRLEFLDVLFGDRPALTPAENFYQRLLANDPKEALVQAETLAEGPLADGLLRRSGARGPASRAQRRDARRRDGGPDAAHQRIGARHRGRSRRCRRFAQDPRAGGRTAREPRKCQRADGRAAGSAVRALRLRAGRAHGVGAVYRGSRRTRRSRRDHRRATLQEARAGRGPRALRALLAQPLRRSGPVGGVDLVRHIVRCRRIAAVSA